MINRIFSLLLLCLAIALPVHAATPLTIENSGFEDGLKGWTARKGEAMFTVTPKSTSLGKSGLYVNDDSDRIGGELASAPIAVVAGNKYQLSFWGRMESAAAGTNIKLEFADAEGKVLKATALPGSWGGTSVKYTGGYVTYSTGMEAPAGATSVRIVIETWGRSTSVTSMDDFKVYDITDGKAPETDLVPLIAEAKAAKDAGKAMPKIVVKLDDLKQDRDRIYPRWQKVADFAKERKIKVGFGIIFKSMEEDAPKYIAWIKDLKATGLFEFWCHGYDHAEWKEGDKTLQEFKGSTYEHQKEHLTRCNQLAKEKLGFPIRSFGAPFNSIDDTARKVLSEDPDIQVIMFADDVPNKVNLPRNFSVNIENPTFVANYPKFVEGYVHNLNEKVFVIQGHPNSWGDDRWQNFVQIVDFLQSLGTEFSFASDFAPKA